MSRQIPVRPLIWFSQSARALQAAHRFGDAEAGEELTKMSERLAWTIVIGLITAALTGGGWFGLQACQSEIAANERVHRNEIETKADVERIRIKAQSESDNRVRQEAATLRLRYVESCRVTPDEAERLVPVEAKP